MADLLGGAYGSASDDDDGSAEEQQNAPSMRVNLAPDVKEEVSSLAFLPKPNTREIFHNLPAETLWAPLVGPRDAAGMGLKDSLDTHNTPGGHVEFTHVSDFTFDQQLYQGRLAQQHELLQRAGQSRKQRQAAQRKRKPGGDSSSASYLGPWAGYDYEDRIAEMTSAARDDDEDDGGDDDGGDGTGRRGASSSSSSSSSSSTTTTTTTTTTTAGDDGSDDEDVTGEGSKQTRRRARYEIAESSVLHVERLHDYQGRSYVVPPSDLKPNEHTCYIPKHVVHTWTGHTKGVNCIRFFPTYGHLLLSAGFDGQVKLWDVYHQRQCLRTFLGHSHGVREVAWNNDGSRFLSASLDRTAKLWDTETGQCLARFSNQKVPYCVRFNPSNNDEFLMGCSDKKVVQWDIRKNATVQEYDRHLGPVNSITFIDDNRRFVTSSDDKTIRIWEYGIPVDIKYIAEPHMHSMPSVAVHPTKPFFCAQSLDNQVLVFDSTGRFKLNRKKHFRGHLTAGNACQINFSPDGQFLVSGDGTGKMVFWNWKTSRLITKIDAHEGVCIGVEYHPIVPSRVASCGWDGTIKLWES